MSVSQQIREKLRAVRQQQMSEQRDLLQDYQSLVMGSIEGREVDPDDAMALIEAAGFTLEAFEQHVATEETRIFNEQIVAGKPDLMRRMREMREAAENRQKEGAEMLRRHQEANLQDLRTEERQRMENRAILEAEQWLSKYQGVGMPLKRPPTGLPEPTVWAVE